MFETMRAVIAPTRVVLKHKKTSCRQQEVFLCANDALVSYLCVLEVWKGESWLSFNV